MALTDENAMVMPVAPMYGSNNSGNAWGNDGWWIILLFILLAGNGGFGGYGNGFDGGLYPWMNQAGITNGGFRDQMINSNIDSIQTGVNGLSTQLCNTSADIIGAINGGFANAETSANARQMANMQTAFAGQTAIAQGFNAIESQLANCCCENRLASADLKYTIATENCADRAALSDGIREIIASNTASTQRILDQLCADKIDAKNDTIAQLRQELLFARGQASQDVQTAELRANNATVANQLLAEMRSCPIPAQPVYGSQPIFTCNNNGCGCGTF